MLAVNPQVMGILNVTPDSFSDGGRYLDPDAAVAHGRLLVEEGADIIDVGGESTRPGARPVDAEEEKRRVLPVIRDLASHCRISIDTMKADVAEAAIDAGATIVNDISASLYEVAGSHGVGWIAMHMQGHPGIMQSDPQYDDVVSEVCAFLLERAEWGAKAGVDEIWLDPGIGFGKTVTHNLQLLRDLRSFTTLGLPIAIGTSRKSFIGKILDQQVEDRFDGSLTTAVWAMAQGVSLVRVHDVAATKNAVRLINAIRGAEAVAAE